LLAALEAFFTADASLWLLFAGSLVAATLVPVSSELILLAVLRLHPELLWPALAVATAGNTAGGMVSYAMGRFIPHRQTIRHEDELRRWGAPALLLAWTPLVGDALCVAAGWLRLNWWQCLAWMALGKAVRYALIAGLAS
jgi:membrane protein YqaA with SNARE-associated domain